MRQCLTAVTNKIKTGQSVSHLVLVRAAHDVEEEVDVRLVEAGEAVQHDDLGVGLVRLGEQVLLERLLLLVDKGINK